MSLTLLRNWICGLSVILLTVCGSVSLYAGPLPHPPNPFREVQNNENKSFQEFEKICPGCYDDYVKCTEPLNSYKMKILADRIEGLLKGQTFTDEKRKNLEEDLIVAREAEKNKTWEFALADKSGRPRYISDLPFEEVVWHSAETAHFQRQIFKKCMTPEYIEYWNIPAFATEDTMTGDEALRKYRQQRSPLPSVCAEGLLVLRYNIMADQMEQKMKTLNLSDKERAQWEEDIAAVRKSAEEGAKMSVSINDPVDPFRPMHRLSSPDEKARLDREFNAQSQAFIEECWEKHPLKM